MSIECPVCGYEGNPPDAEFCETCGAELETMATSSLNTSSPIITEVTQSSPPVPAAASMQSLTAISPPASSGVMATARLVAKLLNAPVPEFTINGNALIGVFTPESGPVDIDLEEFPGSETISKHHAEIIYENGAWILKDQSKNGTYIKSVGQTRFSARIMEPTSLKFGDQIAFAKIIFTFQSS